MKYAILNINKDTIITCNDKVTISEIVKVSTDTITRRKLPSIINGFKVYLIDEVIKSNRGGLRGHSNSF